MERRSFIKNTSAAFSIPVLLNGMGLSALSRPFLFNALEESDKVLVLIQLNGGNDGLHMVIPIDQYRNLANARPNFVIPEQKALKVTNKVGFHPKMTGIQNLFNEGKLGIVQSVGYPNQNRSHFRSTEIWTTGSPAEETWTSGWMGRYLDQQYPGFPDAYPNEENPDPFAITMGYSVSQTCQGQAANISLTLNDPFSLIQFPEGISRELNNTYFREELEYLQSVIVQTNKYGTRIQNAANSGNNLADYPDTKLATQLKNVALLIAGGLKTKVYIVSLEGFDTHANQIEDGDPTEGMHALLLSTLSEAVTAFQNDLQRLGLEKRVVGMTFSEFGRQIKSNSSHGTDHGTAAPLLLFGSCINPGILGNNPTISAQLQDQEGVAMQYDFRDVYGSILMDWFDLSEDNVRSLLHPTFRHLPIISCDATTRVQAERPEEVMEVENYPNPFREETIIQFSSETERVRLSIFDALGNEIQVLMDKTLPKGAHQVRFDGRRLPAGAYFYRLVMENQQVTKRMIKIE